MDARSVWAGCQWPAGCWCRSRAVAVGLPAADKLYMDVVAGADIVVGQGAERPRPDPMESARQANVLRASRYACDILELRPDVAERGRRPDIQYEVLPVLVARHVEADRRGPPRSAPLPLPLLGFRAALGGGASRGLRHN